MHQCQFLNCPPGLGFSPPAIVLNITPTGRTLLALPCLGPRKAEPPATDGRVEALATCHLEGLRVRAGGVISTPSVLEGSDSREDLVANRSKFGKVLRSEGPRHNTRSAGSQSTRHSAFRRPG